MDLPKGIRQRGNSFFVDVTVKGIRKTATCPSVEQAIEKRQKLQEDMIEAHTDLESGIQTWTLKKALDVTKSVYWDDALSGDSLIRNANYALKYFGKFCLLHDITYDRIDSYVEHLMEQGNSNATINRKLASLSKMLTMAHQRGGLKNKPHIQRKREGVGRIRFLTLKEEETCLSLLTQIGKDDHLDSFVTLIDTGMRPSELWRMSTQDIDEINGVIHIWRTKNDHARSTPMTNRVKGILSRRQERYRFGELFPYDNYWFQQVWDRMKTIMNLNHDKQFVPYALRHTCASRLVQRGVHLKVVQEWLGHKSIQTTMRYAHLCPTNLIEAVKVLDAVQERAEVA